MPNIIIDCPEEVLISLKQDTASFGRNLALTAAMKFYELGQLSSGKAARLAGISRIDFLRRTSDFKVPAWDLTEDELIEDLKNA